MPREAMQLPSSEDLELVTYLVTGDNCCAFASLLPEQRIMVINICIQADIAECLNSISNDLVDIGDWFKNSKLWEGS